MKIFRENKIIITDWYSKTIASGRLINYHSTQPKSQKINTALNLITTALKLSDNKFKSKNIDKLRDILIKNSYPTYLINNLIKKAQTEKELGENINNTSGNTKYYSLPYIPKLTENKQIQEIIKDNEVKLAHRASKTINTLFTQTKTKIEKSEQSNLVYEITCLGKTDEECGKVYVGTTKRSLGTRISEHETDIRKNKTTTALAMHCVEEKHLPDLTNVKILDKEKRTNKRYTLESLRIQEKATNALNTKDDKNNTNAIYTIAIF